MSTYSPIQRHAAELRGRRVEVDAIDELIEAVRAGESRALVVRGEPGVGKTALLGLRGRTGVGLSVERAVGVQSEMELAFAALHQLCAPMLDRLERLPVPQRDALRTAFGISPGPAPDLFLVGLAVLSLLSDVAEERPLICLVDDEQWLDRASAQALAFVARRLEAESVGLVFAARAPSADLAGLPELVVEGLARGRCARAAGLGADRAARHAGARPDPHRDARQPARVVGAAEGVDAGGTGGRVRAAERGIALEDDRGELPPAARSASRRDPAPAAGRGGRSGGRAVAGVASSRAARDRRSRLRRRRSRRVCSSSAPGCGFVIRWSARRPTGPRRFEERHDVHRALAEATDPESDPDRRAWHRAQAAPGPDEDVAEELERSAGRAQARGGFAAAAAFLERAALLTADPARRAQRLLAAASAKHDAGALDAALGLLVAVEAGPLDPFQRARVDLLRGKIALEQRRPR